MSTDTPKAEVEIQHCGHCDGALVWTGNAYAHVNRASNCIAFDGHEPTAALAPAEREPPARVWLQRSPDGSLDNRYIWTAGDYEYAYLAPIRKALERCHTYPTDQGSIVMSESDWEELCNAINGK